MSKRTKIFISYASTDKEQKRIVRKRLSKLLDIDRFLIWDDSNISHGKYESVIKKQIHESDIFIFLISDSFLKSDFIVNKELPWIQNIYRR